MDNIKKFPIKYSHKSEIKLINGGNIKMEEDYIFQSSDKVTNMSQRTSGMKLKFAFQELKKYFSN